MMNRFVSSFTLATATCFTAVCVIPSQAQGSAAYSAPALAYGVDQAATKMTHDVSSVDSGSVPAGKALVYIIELMPSVPIVTSHLRVGVDGSWVAQLSAQTFTTLTLDPGTHHFCTRYEGKAVPSEIGSTVLRRLEVEPGKVYYLLYRGFLTREAGEVGLLDVVDEDEGRYALGRAEHLTVAHNTK